MTQDTREHGVAPLHRKDREQSFPAGAEAIGLQQMKTGKIEKVLAKAQQLAVQAPYDAEMHAGYITQQQAVKMPA